MSSPAELANAEYQGFLVGYFGTVAAVIFAGFYFARSLGKKKGVKLVWWPIVISLVVSILGIAGFNPDEKKQELRDIYGLGSNG